MMMSLSKLNKITKENKMLQRICESLRLIYDIMVSFTMLKGSPTSAHYISEQLHYNKQDIFCLISFYIFTIFFPKAC